jgi:glucose-1-phosphate cytidylyltransferase
VPFIQRAATPVGNALWRTFVKVVILAGGLGTRLSEETQVRPKPMAEIGERPLLWHIMKIYGHHGLTDFVVCLGYKGYVIKEYFANYFLHSSDVTFDLRGRGMEVHDGDVEPWRVTLLDTGPDTQTGGRVKRVAGHLDGETFLLTYGDGLADIDISALLAFHRAHGRLATVTAVQPLGRFGALQLDETQQRVTSFAEKPAGDGAWVNGGFFVLEPGVLDYIAGDDTYFEHEPLERLARDGELMAYRHRGFWQPMDVLRDKNLLEQLWQSGRAPWRVW